MEIIVNIIFFIIIFIHRLTNISCSESCNELVCGSIVSKCLLTQSCQCQLNDCFCCKDCLYCLGNLFSECCNCLDICPEHNDTLNNLIPKSQVSDFDGIPELFDTLTFDSDDNEKWQTYRYPIDLNQFGHQHYNKFNPNDYVNSQMALQKLLKAAELQQFINCTVIFLNHCITNTKCSEYCESMGANSYRWFHDGCCECIGSTCINYGINESRCSACPDDENDNDVDEEDDFYDTNNEYDNEESWEYGEND